MPTQDSPGAAAGDASSAAPTCPKCNGPMWDNRESKRNPRAPDFKCKDRSCDGVIWPPRNGAPASTSASTPARTPVSTPVAGASGAGASAARTSSAASPSGAKVDELGMPLCPICGGPMWDDRLSKRNPRAPDFKCKNKPRERGGPGCEGVIWPSRDGSPSPYPPPKQRASRPSAYSAPPAYDGPPPDEPPPDDDDLPF